MLEYNWVDYDIWQRSAEMRLVKEFRSLSIPTVKRGKLLCLKCNYCNFIDQKYDQIKLLKVMLDEILSFIILISLSFFNLFSIKGNLSVNQIEIRPSNSSSYLINFFQPKMSSPRNLQPTSLLQMTQKSGKNYVKRPKNTAKLQEAS